MSLFIEVTLPIVLTIYGVTWLAIRSTNKRFDAIDARLAQILKIQGNTE